MKIRLRPHKRGGGKWSIDYYCPATGKRRYESYATKKEAERRRKELLGQHATGQYVGVERRTWQAFMVEYRERYLIHKPPSTRRQYEMSLANFERLSHPRLLAKITTRVVDQFRAARARERRVRGGAPLSAATVNKDIRALRTALRVAYQWGYMPRLPEFHLLKMADREPRPIPPMLFQRILRVAAELDSRPPKPSGQWWVALLSTAYLAGLRLGELLALRWRDVSFAGGELRIRNEKAGRIEIMPMPGPLADCLQCWMAQQPGDAIADGQLVFPLDCHHRTVQATWPKIQRQARVDAPFRFHDLRVSFCTNCIAAGIEAATLKSLARHRDIATTLKYYRGRTAEADRRAIDRMATSVGPLLEGEVENVLENVLQSRPTGQSPTAYPATT